MVTELEEVETGAVLEEVVAVKEEDKKRQDTLLKKKKKDFFQFIRLKEALMLDT